MQLDYLIFLSLLYLFFLFPKITKVDGDLCAAASCIINPWHCMQNWRCTVSLFTT